MTVEETGGALSDHYDPRSKVVRLSSDNFHGHSLAGLAVAALLWGYLTYWAAADGARRGTG